MSIELIEGLKAQIEGLKGQIEGLRAQIEYYKLLETAIPPQMKQRLMMHSPKAEKVE